MLSRREFLVHTAAATAVMALPVGVRQARRSRLMVLDLEEHCSLRESLNGYRAVILRSKATKDPAFPASGWPLPLMMARSVVIPAATNIDLSTAELILTCLHQGGTVLLESGAAFGDFPRHRDQLRKYFQVLVEPPVDLWPARGIPYVEYKWPIAATVRDFSRVIPLAPQRGNVIARLDGVPVALARRIGAGTLVFLGSPLGPALWARDVAARRWLEALLLSGAAHQT